MLSEIFRNIALDTWNGLTVTSITWRLKPLMEGEDDDDDEDDDDHDDVDDVDDDDLG